MQQQQQTDLQQHHCRRCCCGVRHLAVADIASNEQANWQRSIFCWRLLSSPSVYNYRIVIDYNDYKDDDSDDNKDDVMTIITSRLVGVT